MTADRPTFGDFVTVACRHLSVAAAAQYANVAPGRDSEDLADGVAHVAAVLMRYTADLTKMVGQLPGERQARLRPWDRAALQAHDALSSAVHVLAEGRATDPMPVHAGGPAEQNLHAAARLLGAGRDLLQGHFASDASGTRLYRSSWSLALTSPSVSRAILAEVSSLALQASAVIPAVPPSGARVHDARRRLNTARYWLTQLDGYVYVAESSEPAASSGREVLHAVPANVMPPRLDAGNSDSVPVLCNAVVSAAERARYAAWAAARVDASSPAISVMSWQWIAAVSTVTSHNCHVLYTTLADRVAAEHAGQLSHDLARAAAHASQAREYWLDSAREFEEVTTEVRGHLTPAALEVADLALWTGRLAYADPGWTIRSGPSLPVRPGSSLVPRPADLPEVVGAIHSASDAVRSLAAANLEQARKAVETRRVLVATRSLSERHNIPLAFTPAPEPNATSLIACCQDTAQAAARAAETSAGIAARVGASSRTLVAARVASREQAETRRQADLAPVRSESAQSASIGPVEARLRTLGVTNTRTLWRASAVDRAAEQVLRDATADLAGSSRTRSSTRAALARRLEKSSASSAGPDDAARLPQRGGVTLTYLEQPEAEP